MEGASGLEHCSDVQVPPDPLTNASYVREVDSGWPLLLPFPIVLPWRPGCRGRTDEGAGITIPYEIFHDVVLLFLQVLALLRNAPGAVIKTPYHTPLHKSWM